MIVERISSCGNGQVTPFFVNVAYAASRSSHTWFVMAEPTFSAKIRLSLVRPIDIVITERSISRAATGLQTTQPEVRSKQKFLRTLTGDPLHVRTGYDLMPTPAALALMEPAAGKLRSAQRMFGARMRALYSMTAACATTWPLRCSAPPQHPSQSGARFEHAGVSDMAFRIHSQTPT
jgi:hypothetical protein